MAQTWDERVRIHFENQPKQTSKEQTVDSREYIKLAMRTEANQEKIRHRVYELGTRATRLDNACRGLVNDAAEVNNVVQVWLEYGKPLDQTHLMEELGDVMWRLAQICSEMNWTFEEIQQANIAKLESRFPEKYSDEQADPDKRDRVAEKEAVATVKPSMWIDLEPDDLIKNGDQIWYEALNCWIPADASMYGYLVGHNQYRRPLYQAEQIYTTGSVTGRVATITKNPSDQINEMDVREQTGQGWAEPVIESDDSADPIITASRKVYGRDGFAVAREIVSGYLDGKAADLALRSIEIAEKKFKGE